ncbi:hypothetical protein F4778DRAFT_527259 [Xylariomycetidae sp. FL2044]|nr:hypothetical protein F4778DRAFT_527259 [Xylariomycetidae sp. FL2044]
MLPTARFRLIRCAWPTNLISRVLLGQLHTTLRSEPRCCPIIMSLPIDPRQSPGPLQVRPLHLTPSYSPGQSGNGDIDELFAHVEATFPSALRDRGWYLTAAAALTACGLQQHLGSLYLYLTRKPAYQTPTERQYLVRRLREALFKTIMICGIPKVMDGIASIARVEREEDQDHTTTRLDWQADEENKQRGERILGQLFRDENKSIGDTFGSHQELSWISVNISYGLFLADHRILDITETELVVLPSIMCQNLSGPTSWHLQASQNIGITREDAQKLQEATNIIAEYAGLRLDQVERVT